jgi:hypothetical protein
MQFGNQTHNDWMILDVWVDAQDYRFGGPDLAVQECERQEE